MKNLFLLLLSFSNYAFADNSSWLTKNGVIITPSEKVNLQTEYKAGNRAIFAGDICSLTEGHLNNIKEACRRIDGSLEIQAFFPDPTVEITKQIKITKKANSFSYSFQTPPLKEGDNNTFTLIIGPINKHFKKILKIKAKLDQRIDFIDKRILKYQLSSKGEKHIAALKSLKQNLIEVINKINTSIEKEPHVITKYSRPLQVEADRPSPYYYHATFNENRLALNIPEGLPRTNVDLNIKAEITNLSSKKNLNKIKEDKYKAMLFIDDILVSESEDFSNPGGEKFVNDYSLTNHQRGKARKIRLELHTLLKSNSGKDKIDKAKYKLIGKIDLPLPAPLELRDQEPPSIALELEDNLKLNNNNLLLSGLITDKSNINYTLLLNNQLVFESDSKVIEYELLLNQGQNDLKVIAIDSWGNRAEITRTIRIDSISPIITVSPISNSLTNQKDLQIHAQIFDQNQAAQTQRFSMTS